MRRGMIALTLVLLTACGGVQDCPTMPPVAQVPMQPPQITPTPESPLPASLIEFHQSMKNMTQAQWGAYKESLIGTRVDGWSGRVVDVWDIQFGNDMLGRYYTDVVTGGLQVLIGLDNNDDGTIRDANGKIVSYSGVKQVSVHILASRETALSMIKDSKVVFSGTISAIGNDSPITVYLSDEVISSVPK